MEISASTSQDSSDTVHPTNVGAESTAKLASSAKPSLAIPEKPKAVSSTKPSAAALPVASAPTTSIPPSTNGGISEARFSSEQSQNGLGASKIRSVLEGCNSTATGSTSIFGSTQVNQKPQGPSSSYVGGFGGSGSFGGSGFFTTSGMSTASGPQIFGSGTKSSSTISTSKNAFGSVQNSQPSHNSTASGQVFGSSPISTSISLFGSPQGNQKGQTSTASGSPFGTSNSGGSQGNKPFQVHVDGTDCMQSITAMTDFKNVSFEVR